MKMVVVTIGEKQFVVFYRFQGQVLMVAFVLNDQGSVCTDWFSDAEIQKGMQEAGVNLTPWATPKKESWVKKFWRENFSK